MSVTNSNLWPSVALILGILLSSLILAVEHWFPYRRPLQIIERYLAGTLALWAGFALWRALVGDIWTPLGLLAINAAGGAVVWGAYRIDEYCANAHKADAVERNDPEL